MIYGYARVSTSGQKKDGNSLEDQRKQLEERNCNGIIEEAYTGTKVERPKFTKLLASLNAGDTLVVTKLDRFARTAVDGVQKVQGLLRRGVRVHILNMGLIEDTPMGRLILTTMLAFAEFERDMIVERTQAGKAIAKLRPGYHEGRPRQYTDKEIDEALFLLQEFSLNMTAKITGISRTTLSRYLNKRGTSSCLPVPINLI